MRVRDPDRAEVYRRVGEVHELFVAVRSAYRVSVSATDEIERDQLAAPARILGYDAPDDDGAAEQLFDDLRRGMARSAAAVDELGESLLG